MKKMKKLLCEIFGHQYRLLRRISSNVRELKCKRCGKEFGMCDNPKSVLPLDMELKSIHDDIVKAGIEVNHLYTR